MLLSLLPGHRELRASRLELPQDGLELAQVARGTHVRLREPLDGRLGALHLVLLAGGRLLLTRPLGLERAQAALVPLGLLPSPPGFAGGRGGIRKEPRPLGLEVVERLAVAERELARLLARLGQLAEPEDALEDLGAVGGRGLEERLEPPLREDHGRGEAAPVEADEPRHLRVDRVLGVERRHRRIGQALELVRRRRVRAARGRARDPIDVAVDREVELDAHRRRAVRDELLHAALVPRRRVVERVRDRLEDRRLARAGVPDDGDEAEVGEVDLALCAEAPQALDAQQPRSHEPRTRSRRSSSRSGSRAVSSASTAWTSVSKVRRTRFARAPRVPRSAR